MQLSFYDASIKCYEQMLDSTAEVLKKGQLHANSAGIPLSEIVDYRLHETMLPFSFQGDLNLASLPWRGQWHA
jgi:hypothetical protein